MYLPKDASRARRREAQAARDNRAELVRLLSTGGVRRRDLLRFGLLAGAGSLAQIHGISPFATSAYADVPTGVPRSPLFGAAPFTQPMPRLNLQQPVPLHTVQRGTETDLVFAGGIEQYPARRLSYHNEFTASGGSAFTNPLTARGPMEGRPPGEFFAHQRWREYLPKVGYVMSLAPASDGICFHPSMPFQGADKVWTFGSGRTDRSVLPPPLIKMRYGEPAIFRLHNRLPLDRHQNGGFGSYSQATHNHNAHNASASDGASNTHFFPGQFYDYHWSTTLARADMVNRGARDRRASGPDGHGGLDYVPGDFRELQSTLWFHDHRFFFTAENVYKGHCGMLNYYSGPDRGHEALDDGVNLRLPSGTLLDWGNIDFDVNLMFCDVAFDQDGQLFFDIFDTDGFVGDVPLVNYAYRPFLEVLPRKYRFRMVAASVARFFRFVLIDEGGNRVPVQIIATDGNLLPAPVTTDILDAMGSGERLDIVVDFSAFGVGDRLKLVNLLEHDDGRGPERQVSLRDALRGIEDDPAVGAVLEFRVVDRVESVDVPGVFHRASHPDRSRVPTQLTEQIPVVAPVRERHIEFGRSTAEPGECFPDCEDREVFPWTIKINGESAHFLNANRVSLLVPRPGEVEHWILENGGSGWDHPVHLHFEEGVTISRTGHPFGAAERLARKDVWRLGKAGSVKIQVRFGEFGGAYVTHCHNAVHEDWAMLFRYDVLTDPRNPLNSRTHVAIAPTPNPTPDGVEFRTPEILPEGNPFDRDFERFPS